MPSPLPRRTAVAVTKSSIPSPLISPTSSTVPPDAGSPTGARNPVDTTELTVIETTFDVLDAYPGGEEKNTAFSDCTPFGSSWVEIRTGR